IKSDIKETIPPKQEDVKQVAALIEKKEEPKVDTAMIKNQVEESDNAAKLKADSISAARTREAELLKQEALRKQDSLEKARMETNAIAEYKKSVVKLKSESSTTAGIGLVFLDILTDQITDTIKVLIPPDTKKTTAVQIKEEEKKFLDIPAVDSVQKETVKTVTTKSNNCKEIAVEEDFFKLRKRMAAESKDDGMITEAKKAFKAKCFSTVQVKNLSTLFLTEESKYKFFDAAYQYVSDFENFSSLQSELKEEYFINRFKAMLRQ
ncbi:MAG TPA: DUF4476 domain-containing protein, partial [Chitinophagaceae bacterium]|nr:DUF4476 domain-containing protein [Chitinophagaceae bacterium]